MKKFLTFLTLIFASHYASANAHVLYEFGSGTYVSQENRMDVRPIASITKLFTAIAVINSGVDLNERVKVIGKSHGRVPNGVYMTRKDLLRASLISSDNRASEALAHHHPGGFDQFIKDINNYLESKVLYNTKIVDSTGLLAGNVSTAADLIEFLSLIKDQPIIREIASERNRAIESARGKRSIKIFLHNTNPEIFVYDNVLISKTGFTNPAGRCVLMLVERKNDIYGVIVLGQKNVKERSKLVKHLLSVELPPNPRPIVNSTVDFTTDFQYTKEE